MDVVARAAALDHVAGQGERRAAKADDAEAVTEMGRYLLDGAADVFEGSGAVGAQGADIFRGADGAMDDGAFAGLKLESRGPWVQGAAGGRRR